MPGGRQFLMLFAARTCPSMSTSHESRAARCVARNSLLHLLSTVDLLAAFAAVRRHLAPDGVFAFDIFNPDDGMLARPPGQRFPVMPLLLSAAGLELVIGGLARAPFGPASRTQVTDIRLSTTLDCPRKFLFFYHFASRVTWLVLAPETWFWGGSGQSRGQFAARSSALAGPRRR